MTEFLVAALRIAFLALLWLFIALAANVIRTDIFGRRVSKRGGVESVEPQTSGPSALVITEGRGAGRRHPLPSGSLSLGRAPDSDVVLDDDYASTRHATLYLDDQDRWILEDLHSTNGTHVNGVRIDAPTIITLEDAFRIGRTEFMLVAGGANPAQGR